VGAEGGIFLSYRREETGHVAGLKGRASWCPADTATEDTLDIARLIVDPGQFRGAALTTLADLPHGFGPLSTTRPSAAMTCRTALTSPRCVNAWG
jgi:hypothetical protein